MNLRALAATLLIASLASSMPAWRLIDPIPVLASLAAPVATDRDEDESLDSMLRRSSERPDQPAKTIGESGRDESPI